MENISQTVSRIKRIVDFRIKAFKRKVKNPTDKQLDILKTKLELKVCDEIGIDYFEFRQVLDNMSSVAGLNEAVSYQTAYTTLKIGDPTFDKLKLVSSIEFYDKLLASEESEFNAELLSESQKRVVSQRERANELNAENLEIVKYAHRGEVICPFCDKKFAIK